MSIQDITTTNNQKKRLLRAINGEHILVQSEDGELLVNVAAYKSFKKGLPAEKSNPAPIEAIIGDGILDFDAEYFVFS